MKKILITFILAILMFNINYAQENEIDKRENMQFGLKTGVNISNVYATEGDGFETDYKLGFSGGLFLTIPIGYYLGIQPEILYSQKGFKATGTILGSTYEFKRRTDYIDIPILFSFKPSEFVNVLIGPQYSYLINKKDVFTTNSTSIENETDINNDNIRKNTVCFTGGIDINVDQIIIGGRVGWDLFKNNGDGTSTTPRYKNMWYQATIGYRF